LQLDEEQESVTKKGVPMARKTQGVYDLVADVLDHMTPPYAEDVIEDVFLAIEMNPTWIRRYRALADELGPKVVNSWMGQYVKRISGMNSVREVPARRVNFIKEYTKLSYSKD
jgi:hypothetical protein